MPTRRYCRICGKTHQPPTGKNCPFRAEVAEMENDLADPPQASVGAFPLMEKFAEQLNSMQSQMNELQQRLSGRSGEDNVGFTMTSQHTGPSVAAGGQMQESMQASSRKTRQNHNVSLMGETNKTAVNSDGTVDDGPIDKRMPSDLQGVAPLLDTHDTDNARLSNKKQEVVCSKQKNGGVNNVNENAHIVELSPVADNFQQLTSPPAAELTRAVNTPNQFRPATHGSNQIAYVANPNAAQGGYPPCYPYAMENVVERGGASAGTVGSACSPEDVGHQGPAQVAYFANSNADHVAVQGGYPLFYPHTADNGVEHGGVPAGALGGARSQGAGQGGYLSYYPHATENAVERGGASAGAVGGARSPGDIGIMQRSPYLQSGYQHGFGPAQQQQGLGTGRSDPHPLPAGPHMQQAGHMNFDLDGRYAADPASQHRNGIPVVNDLRNDNSINTQVARRLAQLDFDSEFVDNNFETHGRRRGKKSGQSRTVEDTVIREIDWPHFYVYRGNERRPTHYSDLTVSEFVLGFLSMIDNPRNGFNRDLMLSLLKDMMNDVSQYGWNQIRNFYKILASGIEMARYDWTDTSQIASIRAQYAHRQVQQPFRQNSRNGVMGHQVANSAALQNGSAKLCVLFQKGECRFQATHEEWMHVCAHCFNVDGLVFNHAEKDCRRKYYNTKNVQKGEN